MTSGLGWAAFSDILQKEIMHSQSWALNGFLPFASVAHHLLFAGNAWPKIQFPKLFGDLHQAQVPGVIWARNSLD